MTCYVDTSIIVPLRSLDALHLAVSVSEGLILATADRHLAESATLIGAEHRLLS